MACNEENIIQAGFYIRGGRFDGIMVYRKTDRKCRNHL